MSDYSEAFVALDTSKLRNAVAIADAGRAGEVRFFGEIENTPAGDGEARAEACRQVRAADVLLRGGADRVRALSADQEPRHRMRGGGAVADSEAAGRSSEDQSARRPQPGKLLRAGELTAVWVPDRRHEAMRDLTRARESGGGGFADASASSVSAFCCGWACTYPGRKTWTKAHMSWLASLKLEHPEQRIAFEEMLLAVRQAQERSSGWSRRSAPQCRTGRWPRW